MMQPYGRVPSKAEAIGNRPSLFLPTVARRHIGHRSFGDHGYRFPEGRKSCCAKCRMGLPENVPTA